MSSMSWEEYVQSNISNFREVYLALPKEARRELRLDITLNPPTQVIVVDFEDPYPKCLIILHHEKSPDMQIQVFENVKYENFFSTIIHDSRFLELVDGETLANIIRNLKDSMPIGRKPSWGLSRSPFKGGWLALYTIDPRSQKTTLGRYLGAQNIDFLLIEYTRKKQRERIDETVVDLKRNVQAIPMEVELRSKIIENAQRLDTQVKQLYEKVEEEIGSVRKLIGSSEKFLDWKAFTTDVEHLKTTHVAKEIFDTEIKRIDEKVDKGLEALNTRIEDLKVIKFWSKRTVLEIALAVWGAIVTLYAAGIIKF